MPQFRFTGPDGQSFTVNAPEGATREQAIAVARKHIASKAKPASRGILRRVDDAVRGVADTLTFGYADEIAASLDALTGRGPDYKTGVTAQRQRDSEGGAERVAGQIGGAFLLPVTRLSRAKGVKGLLGSAAEGAGYGALYGSGSAEGGVRERLEGAESGAKRGAGGAAAGRVVGNTASRALRGKEVSPAVRKLADEGVVMTPGRRGGPIRRTYEEAVLGSIPFVKSVPQAANRRSYEQLNVATYNRILKPLGQKLPMSTTPGKEAVAMVGDIAYTAYDDAAARLVLGKDGALDSAVAGIGERATKAAPAAKAVIDDLLAPLESGPVSGDGVRAILQDLRGEASGFAGSATYGERKVGKVLWDVHDALEDALTRQNDASVVKDFQAARDAVKLFKRVESAAAKSPDGVFNAQQLRTAVTKRGYGTTTGKVARGEAPMQDLADAAKEVLPASIPNSGTPERVAALAALGGGPTLGAVVDPTMGMLTTIPLMSYIPGVDRMLQNFSINRPQIFLQGADAITGAAPYIGTAGALTAADQSR